MSDQSMPPVDRPAIEDDLREARKHLDRAGAILREALTEDARLAAQMDGDQADRDQQ